MKEFSVYRHPTKGFEAVKQGFSWPGFFFTWIWAFMKGLWGIGIVLTVLHFVQLGLTGSRDLGPLGILLGLGLVLTVGFAGNGWRLKALRRSTWEFVDTVSARNPKAAAEQVSEHAVVASFLHFREAPAAAAPTTTTAPTPTRRFSVWGVIIAGILFLSVLGNLVAMLVGDAPGVVMPMIGIGIPAVALLVRSFRMPMGFWRGLAVFFGGLLIGSQVGMAGAADFNPIAFLVVLVMGGGVIWFGFTKPQPKQKAAVDTPGASDGPETGRQAA